MHFDDYIEERKDIGREHPYQGSEKDPEARWYDFRKKPELVRQVLEDFNPWEHYGAIQKFYEMLEWINGPSSNLESSDCEFGPPAPNVSSPQFEKALQTSGRLAIFPRPIFLHGSPDHMDWVRRTFRYHVKNVRNDIHWGAIGAGFIPVRYMIEGGPVHSKQLAIRFWSWGDEEAETMANLEITFEGLFDALQKLSDHLPQKFPQNFTDNSVSR